MKNQNFTLTLQTKQSPQNVFLIILDVRNWWSGYYSEEIEGNTANLNDEFSYRAGDGVHYSKHKLVEMIPGKKIVWLTTDSDLSFLAQKDEWTGTKLIFEITPEGNTTLLTFTHEGLTPEIECYGACAPVWTQYLQNKLLPLINGNKDTNPDE